MARIEKTVFISYRRTDCWPALAVFRDLTQHGYDVFIDYDGVASGDFERAIVDNIRVRAHFIVLLTPTALERCDEPTDWLRREIEVALEARRNIVPLLLDGFRFDAPIAVQRLQGSLEALRRYQALKVPEEFFDPAMERLRSKYLTVSVEAVLHSASEHAQQVANEQRDAASKAAALAPAGEKMSAHSAALAIEARDGTIHFGDDKYENNGSFTVECRFYVLVGAEAITLLSINGLYYAFGCGSLPGVRNVSLAVDSSVHRIGLEGELEPPARLRPHSRVAITYFHDFRPPLRNRTPVDCDNGDIRVTLDWRTDSLLKTQSTPTIFCFTGIRKMELADSLRPPPRLSDAELREFVTKGELTEADLPKLLALTPIERYMEAFTDNETHWTDYLAACLLKQLVGNPIKPRF